MVHHSINKKTTGRRKFLKTLMSLGASFGFFASFKANAARPGAERIKMLTPDGKLVSVDASKIAKLTHTPPASNTEVQQWMNTNGNKEKHI